MNETLRCPDCGAPWDEEQTCTEYFHLLLAWEFEYLLPDEHHLLVLCYHLQHPHLYSAEMLPLGVQMLVTFVEEGITPQEYRRRHSHEVQSDVRTYKITGTPESHGVYVRPVAWHYTIADVVANGLDQYYGSVRDWSRSILADLRASGNP